MGMSFYQSEWNNNLDSVAFKRKFRWRLFIDGVSVDGTDALPPQKAARPSMSFKEMEAQHLNEVIYFPSKPDWKPVQIVLFDIVKCDSGNVINPIFMWLTRQYDPRLSACADWKPALDGPGLKAANVRLSLYDGCENVLETWVYEHAYPQSVEFGELDMGSSDVVVCEATLRYDRAYIINPEGAATINFATTISNDPCPQMPSYGPSYTMFGGAEQITFESLF